MAGTVLLAATALAVLALSPTSGAAAEPSPTPLWPDGAPGARGKTEADVPAVFEYLPPKEGATGAAVIVCPGGAYGMLAMDHEGHAVAAWLRSFGVAAFVLRYRHAPGYRYPTPMLDASRAVQFVRANAQRLGLDPKRIGIMGFSAGGHLAATTATRFDEGEGGARDPVDRVSSRPDFAILCYPVITMAFPKTNTGSRDNLLGPDPTDDTVAALSAERNVSARTPPIFLFHTSDDTAVPVENTLWFYTACLRAGVPAEMHVYRSGPHGVGMDRHPPAATWPGLARDWMANLGLLRRS